MSSPPPSSLWLPYFLTCEVQMLFTWRQFSYYPCFPSKRTSILSHIHDQSFLISVLPSSLCPSNPHLSADGEKVKFQHSSSTSNGKMFRATLSSAHKAFPHKEAQSSCFQTSLEKFKMLKWQTNVQRKDPKGRYHALWGRLHISLPTLASLEVLQ